MDIVMRSHRLSLPLAVASACISVGLVASVCHAYVRRTAMETSQPLGWRGRTMEITGYSQGLDEMTLDQINTAMTGAAAPWTKADPTLALCTDLDLRVQVVDPAQTPPAAARDMHNIIAVRHDTWDHEAQALALTSVFYFTKTGEIVEADVEVNARDFRWADVTTDLRADRQDLQNALTHELGHFIGLDHTCYLGGMAPNETDDVGNPVPLCTSALARTDAIQESTMFPSATARDIDKRTLSADDQKAVCDIYPLGQTTVGIGVGGGGGGGCNCDVGSLDGSTVHPAATKWGRRMLWRSMFAVGLLGWAVSSRRARRRSQASR
jgi:hypothetical protein